MTLQIDLPPDLEDYIQSKVAARRYAGASEFFVEVIRHLQAEDTRLAAWHAAIKIGNDQLDRGEGIPFSVDTLVEVTDCAIKAMYTREPMDPDVLP